MMLSLDDPGWQALCAHGNAADLPGLLRSLKGTADPRQTAALTAGLAEYLCPEDEVYAAAYAVLPYLVDLAAGQPPGERLPALRLAGRIAALAQRPEAPTILPEQRAEYEAALARAADLVLECLRLPHSAADLAALCGVLAATHGQAALAIDLLETLRDPRQVQCPVCEQFYATLGYELIHGAAEA